MQIVATLQYVAKKEKVVLPDEFAERLAVKRAARARHCHLISWPPCHIHSMNSRLAFLSPSASLDVQLTALKSKAAVFCAAG